MPRRLKDERSLKCKMRSSRPIKGVAHYIRRGIAKECLFYLTKKSISSESGLARQSKNRTLAHRYNENRVSNRTLSAKDIRTIYLPIKSKKNAQFRNVCHVMYSSKSARGRWRVKGTGTVEEHHGTCVPVVGNLSPT